MTSEELKKLLASLKIDYNYAMMHDPAWEAAFKFYNNNHEQQLSRGCRPCYHKVYMFIQKTIDQLSERSGQ